MNTRTTDSLLLFINIKEQSLFYQQPPGTHSILPLRASPSQLANLQKVSGFHITKGPLFNTAQEAYYIFYQQKSDDLLPLLSSLLNIERGLLKISPFSECATLLKTTKSLDASFYTLFYYYLNQQKEPLFLYELHINFIFQYFRTDYFNQWYSDNVDFFEQHGLTFSFVAQDPPQVSISAKTFCTKSTIEEIVFKLKDLGKHYSQRIWCTQIIDSIESIEDFSNL